MHTVIGFFSYEDFISEITGVAPVVRVQEYHRVRPVTNSAEWIDYYVELAARREYPPQDEIYVCRFEIGGGLAFNQENRQRDGENARRAVEALRQDLERRGFVVKTGTFAAAKESDAVAPGPWHFEKDEQGLPMLVPDLPLPTARRWKRENLEIQVWGEDELDEISRCTELAGIKMVLQVYLGEDGIDPGLAGLALHLLDRAGATIDEGD